MINNNHRLSLTLMCALAVASVSHQANAITPANKDQIRLHTSTPKKNGETLFSYTASWRIDDGLTYRSTALTFIHGPDHPKATTDVEVSKKLVIALNDAMEYLYPSWRGATVEQTEGKPEITVSNAEKFDFTQLTFRDYSNQDISFDLLGNSFSSKKVGISFDIVYAADVENIADFTPQKPKISTGGNIDIKIDGVTKASVKTDNKTTAQIEKDLAAALGGIAKYSETPIFPNIKDETTRNYKPFDGGEVQLINLTAESVGIDVNDPSLGVLVKFDFPDINKPLDVAGNIFYIVFAGLAAVFGFIFFKWYSKPKTEDESDQV